MKTEICTECKATVHPLEVFPGPRCLDCHAGNFDRMSESERLTEMNRVLYDAFVDGKIFNNAKGEQA